MLLGKYPDLAIFYACSGVDAISVTMHACRMQSLLNGVHQAENSRSTAKTARRNLRHYIYMYCACKMWQRVTARAPRFGHQVIQFFLDKNGQNLLLNEEAFGGQFRIPSAYCLLDQDETWLKDQLSVFDQTGTVEYELQEVLLENSKVVRHLRLDKKVLWNLYRFAARCIQRIRQSIFGIRTWIGAPKAGRELPKKTRERMETMLDDLHSAFYRVYKLLHNCPSFWRLVDLLGIISVAKLAELKVGTER